MLRAANNEQCTKRREREKSETKKKGENRREKKTWERLNTITLWHVVWLFVSLRFHTRYTHTHTTHHTSVKWFLSHRSRAFLPFACISFSFDHHRSPFVEYIFFPFISNLHVCARVYSLHSVYCVRGLCFLFFPSWSRRIVHTSSSSPYRRFKGTTVMSFSLRIHSVFHSVLFRIISILRFLQLFPAWCCCIFRQ